mgnify:CR=1 FL=1
MASSQEQLWDGACSGDLLKVKQAVAAGINVDAVIYDLSHVSGLTGRVWQFVAGCECLAGE